MKQEATEQQRTQRQAALRRLMQNVTQLFHEYGGHVMESFDACHRGQNTALHKHWIIIKMDQCQRYES
jgi:hypothetical protein